MGIDIILLILVHLALIFINIFDLKSSSLLKRKSSRILLIYSGMMFIVGVIIWAVYRETIIIYICIQGSIFFLNVLWNRIMRHIASE